MKPAPTAAGSSLTGQIPCPIRQAPVSAVPAVRGPRYRGHAYHAPARASGLSGRYLAGRRLRFNRVERLPASPMTTEYPDCSCMRMWLPVSAKAITDIIRAGQVPSQRSAVLRLEQQAYVSFGQAHMPVSGSCCPFHEPRASPRPRGPIRNHVVQSCPQVAAPAGSIRSVRSSCQPTAESTVKVARRVSAAPAARQAGSVTAATVHERGTVAVLRGHKAELALMAAPPA